MIPLKDTFFIKAHKYQNDMLQYGALKIFIDTRFSPEKHAVQNGVIETVPKKYDLKDYVGRKLAARKDIQLKNGDRVYFHHFVVTGAPALNINNKEVYRAEYQNIYCTINSTGDIQMLEHWMFVTPIMEENNEVVFSGKKIITNAFSNKISLYGTIEHVHDYYNNLGLKKGTKIIFTKGSEYSISVEGKDYFRMCYNDVVAYLGNNGELIPLKDRVILIPNENKKIIKGGVEIDSESLERKLAIITGIVFKSGMENINEGDVVYYEKGRATSFEHDGKIYLFVKKENIAGLF